MYTLYTRSSKITSDDPADLVDALYGGTDYHELTAEQRLIMREKIAYHFRHAAQAYAISLYPVQTITTLTPGEQDILYQTHPRIESWFHLPPLVLVNGDGNRTVEGTIIDGVSTVEWIDYHSDESLLRSLTRCGVIRVDYSAAAS